MKSDCHSTWYYRHATLAQPTSLLRLFLLKSHFLKVKNQISERHSVEDESLFIHSVSQSVFVKHISLPRMLFILESLLVIQCCHHCHHHNHQHYHYPPLHRRHTTEYQLALWAFMEMWTVCTPYGARWGSRWGNSEHEYKSICKCVCISTLSQVLRSETKGSY